MADQFVDKDIRLSDLISFLRQQEAAQHDAAQDKRDDWDFYHLHNDAANTIDMMISDIIAHFNEAELREASFKINNGRSELAGIMANESVVLTQRMRAERRATKTVAQMSETDVFVELTRRGYTWNGKKWVMGR